MDKSHTPDYTVGYRQPPQHTRFKKGQSGNPKGRPKGRIKFADVDDVLSDVMNDTIHVNENGRARKLRKIEALLISETHKALKGNHQSTKLVLALLASAQARDKLGGHVADVTVEERRRELDATFDKIASNLAKSAKRPESHS